MQQRHASPVLGMRPHFPPCLAGHCFDSIVASFLFHPLFPRLPLFVLIVLAYLRGHTRKHAQPHSHSHSQSSPTLNPGTTPQACRLSLATCQISCQVIQKPTQSQTILAPKLHRSPGLWPRLAKPNSVQAEESQIRNTLTNQSSRHKPRPDVVPAPRQRQQVPLQQLLSDLPHPSLPAPCLRTYLQANEAVCRPLKPPLDA